MLRRNSVLVHICKNICCDNHHISQICSLQNKKMLGDPDCLGCFLMDQVDLTCKLNIWIWPGLLIDDMFFRKWHWYLISEWSLGLVNAPNHHWCEPLTTSSCFEACGDKIFQWQEFCAWDQCSILLRTKKHIALFHI